MNQKANIFFLFFFLFIHCSTNQIKNTEKLFYDISSNNISLDKPTVFSVSQESLVKKYGVPSEIFEFTYRNDPYGKTIVIYYGGHFVTDEKYENYEKYFKFYVLNDGNSYLQDWEINDDFYQCSKLLNIVNIDKRYIKKTFGGDYKESFSDYFHDRSEIIYRIKNGTLIFIFMNDVLTKVKWSMDR